MMRMLMAVAVLLGVLVLATLPSVLGLPWRLGEAWRTRYLRAGKFGLSRGEAASRGRVL
jgi:hypothetical protein